MKTKIQPPSCLIAQYFLNHKLRVEEVEKHLREFATKGYQGVFAHARQGLLTPYMSNDWWEIIDAMVRTCERLGLEFWIWDEDYYPSGTAGGRVVWGHPELAAKTLRFTIRRSDHEDEIEVDFPKGHLLKAYAIALDARDQIVEVIDIGDYCGTRRQRWGDRELRHTMYSPSLISSGQPHWRCSFVDNRYAVCWRPKKKGVYAIVGVTVENLTEGARVDLLNPLATRELLNVTHERYSRRYRRRFGAAVRGSFFDEPAPACDLYPWTPEFPKAFREDHGYDILERLAHLAWDIDATSPTVRYHFRQTQHRLQTLSYLDQTHRWHAKRGLIFTGHLTRTEWLGLNASWWPDELRCYRYMDIPCCDPLGSAYGWKNTRAYHAGLKVVSSAATRESVLDNLGDWANLGYPTYSGEAEYVHAFRVETDGLYAIDLGRVEDLAEIVIDGRQKKTLAWPPYRHVFKLGRGDHQLSVKIVNSPGNGRRGACLPAGLLGPVKILRRA